MVGRIEQDDDNRLDAELHGRSQVARSDAFTTASNSGSPSGWARSRYMSFDRATVSTARLPLPRVAGPVSSFQLSDLPFSISITVAHAARPLPSRSFCSKGLPDSLNHLHMSRCVAASRRSPVSRVARADNQRAAGGPEDDGVGRGTGRADRARRHGVAGKACRPSRPRRSHRTRIRSRKGQAPRGGLTGAEARTRCLSAAVALPFPHRETGFEPATAPPPVGLGTAEELVRPASSVRRRLSLSCTSPARRAIS